MGDKNKGLINKYNVSRTDGRDKPGRDRQNAMCFVLDITYCPFSRTAALAYADACEAEYPALAKDLRDMIKEITIGNG